VVNALRRQFTDIYDLCQLAPRLPTGDDYYIKNTEYPYNLPDGMWTAPAASGSFTAEHVRRFTRVARSSRAWAQKITTAARLNPKL
jgi:hypothetical protein